MTKLAVVIMFRDRPWSSGNDLIVTYVIKAPYMTSDNDYAADECREIQQTTKTFTNFPAAFSLQILILRSHLMRIFVMDLSSGPWLLYHVTRYNTVISAQVKYTHAVIYYQSSHHAPYPTMCPACFKQVACCSLQNRPWHLSCPKYLSTDSNDPSVNYPNTIHHPGFIKDHTLRCHLTTAKIRPLKRSPADNTLCKFQNRQHHITVRLHTILFRNVHSNLSFVKWR